MTFGTKEDEMWGSWHPRLPDLTPCDFFLWGYVKHNVFVSSLLTDIPGVNHRITEVAMSIITNMLVWGELEYQVISAM
jgi:hypothetical protein